MEVEFKLKFPPTQQKIPQNGEGEDLL